MTKGTWKPNTTQITFLEALRENPGLTLAELSEIAGMSFKSGAINALVAKGLVRSEDNEFECFVVRKDNGKTVGSCKKKAKVYFEADGAQD